jgi:hypothetical protein
MIANFIVQSPSFRDIVKAVSSDLVRVQEIGQSFYVNLPMVYPDGSFVTVKLDKIAGEVLVSDAGFAYREAEDVGSNRSFRRMANKIAEDYSVTIGERTISTRTSFEGMERAICDVATVSWRVATTINERAFEEGDAELSEELTTRLKSVFGADKVVEGECLIGQSTTEWPVSAVVTVEGHKAVFQAVSEHPNSVYRASTAFRDLASAEKQLRLVSFVRSKAALGTKLSLLAPSKIVEESQADELLRRAAA